MFASSPKSGSMHLVVGEIPDRQPLPVTLARLIEAGGVDSLEISYSDTCSSENPTKGTVPCSVWCQERYEGVRAVASCLAKGVVQDEHSG
jgi:hypothetical protein